VTVAGVAAVALGLVFVASGASKVFSRAWPVQAHALGTPAVLIGPLPWIELGLGAAAVGRLGGRAVIAAMALLLAAFTAALVRALVRGEHPPCACFGAWSTRPIGWGSVSRNAVFLAAAVVALLGPR
jgi:hypothetical protein